MGTLPRRLPLSVQVGAVAALFVAALATLWSTYSSVVEREGRRASAKDVLDRAGERLATRGADILGTVPRWNVLEYQDPRDWEALDRRLGEQADAAVSRCPGVEGGFFLRDLKRFVGTSLPPGPRKEVRKRAPRRPPGPPPREADLIEIQVDAAIRKNQVLFVVEVVPPSTVAIRTAPVLVDGQVVAATWTMTRLVDPLFLDQSLRGYRLAAGLALAGIALALVWIWGLARTVQRQAIERDQLQNELRRSERLAALGKLLAGVAHEVRNPLAGIRSTVQLWQRGIGPDDDSFADLVAEADRLDEIVARLLHFSKADAQTLAPGDLNAVVSEVARLMRPNAEGQGVRIDVELAPTLPTVMMAPPALVQVLRNLATNALQAMPEGGTLRFTTRLAPSGQSIEVCVADTGPGLGAELLNHLFEPFYTTKPGGTGLGLAIAREIALAHRGELRAGNQAAGMRGAVFTLVLPIAPTPARKEAENARA